MTNKELYEVALEMTAKSYAPFSKFRVGAALLTKDGKLYKLLALSGDAMRVSLYAHGNLSLDATIAISQSHQKTHRRFQFPGLQNLVALTHPWLLPTAPL